MSEQQLNIPEGGLDLRSAAALLVERNDSNRENDTAEEPRETESEALADGEAEVEQSEEELEQVELQGDEDSYEEAEEVERFIVKVDGEEIEVDIDELTKGYSRQASYTKKSQKLADEAREFEAQRDAVLQERAVYADLLGKMQNRILSEDAVKEPDWDALYDENPIQASKQKYQWDKAQKEREVQLSKKAAEQNRLSEELKKEQSKAMQEIVATETIKVREAIPGWSDDKGFKEGATQLREWLIDFGMEEDDVNAMVKSKHVEIAEMARKYALGQTKTKDRPTNTRTVKAGSSRRTKANPKSKATKALNERLQKTGRLQDAAELAKLLEL